MVLLNFAGNAATITRPFPKAGNWTEMIDADIRTQRLTIAADGSTQPVSVPSNYGCAFVWPS